MFDGSSIAGWKAINESDMILKPDLDAWYVDPFSATPMGILFCDIVDPGTGELYARDPRSTAKRAEAYLKATGVGDTIYVGPEAEFFMFDDVRFEDGYNASAFHLDDIELPTNTATKYENGNLAHRPRAKGGYFPVAPVDSAVDIRGEMVSTMIEMGLPMDKHHHEVAAAQHELGLTFGTLTETADRMQIYKYVVHHGRPRLRQDRDLHAQADQGRQRLGHAHPHVDLERRQAALRRQRLCGPLRDLPLFHRRRDQARQARSTPSPIRRPTATSASSPASRRRCCSLIRAATAPPPAASPMAPARRRSASSSASRTRSPIPISLIRRC